MTLAPLLSALTAAAAGLPDLDQPEPSGTVAAGDVALVVGIEDYFKLPDVSHARRDAELVYRHLLYTRGVPAERIRLLDQGANREQLLHAARELGELAGPDDVAWVYFAGHGAASPDDGEPLLVGVDAWGDAVVSRSVGLPELRAEVGRGGARAVLLADTGFGGLGRDGTELLQGARLAVPVGVLERTSDVIWVASDPQRAPASLEPVEHGAFTYLAVGALRGWADGFLDGTADGAVTAEEAQAYVADAMRELELAQRPVLWSGQGELARGLEQGPVLARGEGDWVVAFEERAAEARAAGEQREDQSIQVHAERVAARTTELQERARREWLGIRASFLPDTQGLFLAAREFHKAWSGREITVDGIEVVVDVPEAELAREAWRGARLDREDWISPTTGYRMVHVPAGTYVVGPPDGEREVELDNGYWIGVTEVTEGMWGEVLGFAEEDAEAEARCAQSDDRDCMSDHYFERWREGWGCAYNKSEERVEMVPTRCPRCPVTGVDASNIQYFLRELSSADELWSVSVAGAYRLPTPDEWEIAARAGGEPAEGKGGGPRPIRGKANAWGLVDMPGNVPELTQEPGWVVTPLGGLERRPPPEGGEPHATGHDSSEDTTHPYQTRSAVDATVGSVCGGYRKEVGGFRIALSE